LDLEELKSKINVREFAEECGLEVTPSNKTYCWHGDERTPSLHLYDDGWWCFRCGEGGDIIDLVIQLKHWSWKRSANFLTEYLGESLTLDEPVQKAERPPVPDMTDEFMQRKGPRVGRHRTLMEECWPGLEVEPYVYGCAEGLMIPHQMDDGRINGIKLRYWDGSKGAVPGSQFTAGLYRPPGFKRESDTTVLCEGESDAWAMASDPKGTWDVLALPSGAGCWKPEWAEQLNQRVFLVMDNDEAGFMAIERIALSLGGRYLVCRPPHGYKDAREAVAAGYRLTVDGDWICG
jgi:DNA primase